MTTETTSAPLDTGAQPPDTGAPPPDTSAPPPEPQQHEQAQHDPRVVPYTALRESREETRREREQRQAYERQMQERLAVIEARSQEWLRPPQREPEPELPSFDQDPAAHLRAQNERHQREFQKLAQKVGQYEALEQQKAERETLFKWANAQEITFQQERPDYPAAVYHFRQHRAAELQAMGVPPEHWQSVIDRDEQAIVAVSRQQGRNPAEAMYATAMARGYQVQQQQRQQMQPAPARPQAPDPATLAMRQEAASSINSIPGSSPPAGPKALLSMSVDEFAKATSDPAKFRKMMGG